MSFSRDLGEYQRIGSLVAKRSKQLSAVARIGYAEHGRGAVFYCEGWEQVLSPEAPFYLPASAPEFEDVGTEIEQAVVRYRPLSEGVVVVITGSDEVYVVRLRLAWGDSNRQEARMH